MDVFLIFAIWLVFGLLVVYTVISWKFNNLEDYQEPIRKTWYMIYLTGVMVFLTKDIESLLTDWKAYVIVLIAFVAIDSLMFLNLYVTKFAGNELRTVKEQVNVTQVELDHWIRKSKRTNDILQAYPYPMYNITKEEYVSELKLLLSEYTSKENIELTMYAYGTSTEQGSALDDLGTVQKRRAIAALKAGYTYFSSGDRMALIPFQILNYPYVIKLEILNENSKLYEVDENAISTLVYAYDLAIDGYVEKGGEEE